ncbi:deoxyribonuclease IV [candidate division KSB1 bacterium]|nr:deoxyribonuclease IV [candidate division KSB1 bacterium]
MDLLGAHVSISGGIHLAPARAADLGCTAFQIFTKNQRQWQAKGIGAEEIHEFESRLKELGYTRQAICAHDSYLINLAAPESEQLHKSRLAFIDEIHRAAALQIPYLVFHPGAHKGAGETDALKRIAESLDFVFDQCPDSMVQALLETTAGQGTALGYRFEQLRQIIDLVANPLHVGVCLDTCHIFAAGYDIRTELAYRETMAQFHEIVRFEKLKVIHLNDSLKSLGSKVDRHANIGRGELGSEAFRLLMNDPELSRLPKILETPGGDDWFRNDLAVLRSLLGTKPCKDDPDAVRTGVMDRSSLPRGNRSE